MRVLVISDVHGNIDALRALELQQGGRVQAFDRVICLGDLVDYGPDPGDVIDWVRAHATDVVRGNHDHAMATGESCRSSPAYLEASMATRSYLRPVLTADHLAYLAGLPARASVPNEASMWHLVHATPADPLFGYLPPEAPDERWRDALDGLGGARILVGHTHLPFVRPVAGGFVVNPGSLGMPKDGNPNGSYVVIDGGSVQFHRIAYDPEPMVQRLVAMDLPRAIVDQLVRTFRTGS